MGEAWREVVTAKQGNYNGGSHDFRLLFVTLVLEKEEDLFVILSPQTSTRALKATKNFPEKMELLCYSLGQTSWHKTPGCQGSFHGFVWMLFDRSDH